MRFDRKKPLIYLISSGTMRDERFEAQASEFAAVAAIAIERNIPLIQIREKRLSARNLFKLSQRICRDAFGSATKVLANDRLDVAIASGAHGVHLTSTSMSPDIVRKLVIDDFLIGVSTHSISDLQNAKAAGADFAVFGPVFETPEKSSPIGLGSLQEAVRAVPGLPVIAIGGVNETNYKDVLTAGAAGFAAIRFLNAGHELRRLSTEFDL